MAADNLKSRIEALNRRPLKNVPDEMDGLRRKLAKQANARAGQVVELGGSAGVSGFERSGNPETPAQAGAKARLTIEPAAPSSASSAFQPVVFSGSTPWPYSTASDLLDDEVVALEQVVQGVAVAAPVGAYYHIECAAVDIDECALELHWCFLPLIGHPDGTAAERIAALCGSKRIAPGEVLFVDIETTGLSNTPVFLIGTMESDEDGFLFKQYFARDYSEEMSILSAFSQRLADARMLVTFNGKSFDMPYIQNRAVATAVKLPHPEHHLDLLHEARRHYGRSLPNHKLQTLEQLVCGRHREDDIPGAEIPAAYHEFVRTGDARKVALIIQHNLRDLLTMADLMVQMWGR